MLDDGEDVVRRATERGRGKEVTGQDRVGSTAEEGGPGLVEALGRGFDPVLFEDLPHGGGGDRVPSVVGSPWMRR